MSVSGSGNNTFLKIYWAGNHQKGAISGPGNLQKAREILYPDGRQLELQYSIELSFRDSISVYHDPVWLETGVLVEADQGVLHHARESADDILPGLLDAGHSTVG